MEEYRKMNRLKALAIATGLGVFGTMLAPNALADQWNKRTILTVNEPVQVPGKVLQPGKYVMKLLDSPANRHIVQIFNGDESNIVTTILALPNYRLEPTGKTEFGFWETPPGQPRALRAWFYPGDNFGQEFAYPKNEAVNIAQYTKTTVPTTYAQNESELTTAQVGTVNEQGTEQPLNNNYQQQTQTEVAQNTTPAPAAEPAPAAAPAPAPAPQQLPKTGSPLPLIGLMGLLSLAAFFTLRVVRES
jgi:LPXTG-motif cell wall-anchored protein